ncbi:glycosyltransferase [Arthrobacter sp. UC242_113]
MADTELYSSYASSTPRNRVFFSGNLTPTKIDFDLLFELADSGANLCIAGPVAIDGTEPTEEVKRLLKYSNVEYLGILEPAELARQVGDSIVGIVPYLVNDHTRGIFPMKIYEYLAAGLNVLCTPLPSLVSAQLPEGISIIPRGDFTSAALRSLDAFNAPDVNVRSSAAQPYSWTNRVRAAVDLVTELSGSARRSSTRLGSGRRD